MGETGLLNHLLRDAELAPTINKVRDAIDYLAMQQLVQVVQVNDSEWLAASITDDGEMWLQSEDDHSLAIYQPSYEPPKLPPNYNGRVSKVDKLPIETREWIDQKLIERSFSDYDGLIKMLKEQGLGITRSSLGRYGKQLKARVAKYKERAEQAKSLAAVFGTDAPMIMQGALGVSVTAVLDAIENGKYNEGNDSLAGLVKALPSLGKGFADAEKQKIEQQARCKTIEEAATVGEDAAVAAGLGSDQARFWREQFLKGM